MTARDRGHRRAGRRLVARELREVVEREQHRVLVALAAHLRVRRVRRRGARRLVAEQVTIVVATVTGGRARGRRREQIARIAADRAGLVAATAAEHRGHRGRAAATTTVDRRGRAAGRDVRREGIDLGQREPVREALAPRIGLTIDLAGREPLLDLGGRHRADLILIDHDVPDALVAAATTTGLGTVVIDAGVLLLRRRSLGCTSTAANDDDVAALLTADLEDLALDLVVGDRVLGLASVTYDLHGRTCIAVRVMDPRVQHSLEI